MNLRSRWTGMATGDQALFVRHDLFCAVGGFPDLPLMEDIAISRMLLRHGAPACLRERVTTSARRWERHGVLPTILLMWRLRAAYFLGADPGRLAFDMAIARDDPEPDLRHGADGGAGQGAVAGLAKTRLIPALGARGAAGCSAS